MALAKVASKPQTSIIAQSNSYLGNLTQHFIFITVRFGYSSSILFLVHKLCSNIFFFLSFCIKYFLSLCAILFFIFYFQQQMFLQQQISIHAMVTIQGFSCTYTYFFLRYVFAMGVFGNRVNSLLLCKPFSASSIEFDLVG